MDPWYKVATPRPEVREGRSFNPDEFAIALEQVVAGTAPPDYRDPEPFFSRTCFTQAFREHAGMVLRRLAGQTENTAPVLTLITQFGGGKTHTLTALYHLARKGEAASKFVGVSDFLKDAGVRAVPAARVGVFVGNAWDPQEGRETPWIDIARQLAGEAGVQALGKTAKTTPPGTEAIARVFEAAGQPVLLLFDEVLNFVNRHRDLAEPFYAFLQNLTVAATGTTQCAALISLPRSQVEMTDWDLHWQEKVTKIVRRVAKDLIANNEAEISEVVRRRLFQDLGSERVRKRVAKAFAEWCFARRAQLPPEWTAVDTASTESKARELLQTRFEACFPFHPATLSVFQRKWQAVHQYQQTRGTLAMLAQWISMAFREGYTKARNEPLLTLGSAPLERSEFRSVVLGQLGESRLWAALEADVAGEHSHAKALDAGTKGPLREIHQRVATAIFFESSGGQVEKVAHLPELRFALGEPELDTTSVDNAALALENRAFFVRRVGSDGFQINHKPTLKKVVNDRKASLDEENEVRPAIRELVQKEFEKGKKMPMAFFPEDSTSIPESPRLTLIVEDPAKEWMGEQEQRQRIADWTLQRGKSARLYPGALIWCFKQPSRTLRDKVEAWLAWTRVERDSREGTLGTDYSSREIEQALREAETAAREEVWGEYRYVILYDRTEKDQLSVIDLGAGHSSSSETLTGRVLAALKSQALLNESVGTGYIERNWPEALKEGGAWPLTSLRQAFLDGSLTRLLDPDQTLRNKIVEWVGKGDFGLASGAQSDGTYQRIWFEEPAPPEEVAFESGVFLLKKEKVKRLKEVARGTPGTGATAGGRDGTTQPGGEGSDTGTQTGTGAGTATGTGTTPQPPGSDDTDGDQTARSIKSVRLRGTIPPESWNRVGTKLLAKLRASGRLSVNVNLEVTLDAKASEATLAEIRQILEDLQLGDEIELEEGE